MESAGEGSTANFTQPIAEKAPPSRSRSAEKGVREDPIEETADTNTDVSSLATQSPQSQSEILGKKTRGKKLQNEPRFGQPKRKSP